MKKCNLFFAVFLWAAVINGQTTDAFITYCEQTGFQKTPRYAETVDYCKRLAAASPFAHYTTFGKSPRGRDLPLLIVDKDGYFTPEAQHKTNKVVMMVIDDVLHTGVIFQRVHRRCFFIKIYPRYRHKVLPPRFRKFV